MRWRLALPTLGLVLFATGTADSLRREPELHRFHNRYFWWESFRLDPDPLRRHPEPSSACEDRKKNCTSWDLRAAWVDPGWLAKALMVTAAPPFFLGAAVISGLGRLGVNEVWTFFIVVPPFIALWYYGVGLFLERSKMKKFRRTQLESQEDRSSS